MKKGIKNYSHIWYQNKCDYVNVYTIGNQLVRQGVYYKHALQGLPTGIYIVGGQKVFWN